MYLLYGICKEIIGLPYSNSLQTTTSFTDSFLAASTQN